MYVIYDSNPVPVTYTQEELKLVIDNYLKDVTSEFSFRGLCSYIIDKAIKERKPGTFAVKPAKEPSAIKGYCPMPASGHPAECIKSYRI